MMHESRFTHYRTGIAEHDEQHWDLLMQMNQLVDTIQSHGDASRVFNKLLTSLSNHFEHEQQYMADVGFPYVKAHAVDHSRMIRELWHMIDRVVSGNSIAVHSTARQLEDVFVNHIDHFDMQYVEWAKQHNGC